MFHLEQILFQPLLDLAEVISSFFHSFSLRFLKFLIFVFCVIEIISEDNGKDFTDSYKNGFTINLIWGMKTNWSEEI
jgi:hypothetical protein